MPKNNRGKNIGKVGKPGWQTTRTGQTQIPQVSPILISPTVGDSNAKITSNVSYVEYLCRLAICHPSSKNIKSILSCSDEIKPILLRGKDEEWIKTSIDNLTKKIKEITQQNKIVLTTNRDNKLGSDLYEVNSKSHIELKFGNATDANLGLKIMEWGLGFGNREISQNMKGGLNLRRGKFFARNTEENILESKNASSAALVALFQSKLKVGEKAPANLTHMAICISRGITNSLEIQALQGKASTIKDTPLLVIDKDGAWDSIDKRFALNETFTVSTIALGERGGAARIILIGDISGAEITFLSHFKNSYTNKATGEKVPAKFGVRSPCFNIWINPPKKP